MTIPITRRRILKEDINFDTTGTGESVTVANTTGTKVNASHVPLSSQTRSLFQDTDNVDSAISNLSQEISNLDSNLSQEISNLDSNLSQEISNLDSNLSQEISNLGSNLSQETIWGIPSNISITE